MIANEVLITTFAVDLGGETMRVSFAFTTASARDNN
jgi:hypothetical protein